MKDRRSKKVNIISFRMSDVERDLIQKIVDTSDKRVSTVIREAFTEFLQQWETSRHAETSMHH